jgi:hypothetical protein
VTRKPVVTARVEADVVAVLDAEAARRGVTRSALVAALAEVFADAVASSSAPGLRPTARHRNRKERP